MDKEISRRDAIKVGVTALGILAASACTSTAHRVSQKDKGHLMKNDYEVLIIGGGPAGLSAAMTLGRMNRKVLICDDNRPRNAPSKHVNNFPSQDGIHPQEWLKRTIHDLEKYKTISTYSGSVISVKKTEDGFFAKLNSNETIKVRKVILAYGVKDVMLPIPGFSELWGKSIFHCPYCHGYEVRGLKLGFIGMSEMSLHALPLIYNLASDLVFFTNKSFKPSHEQLAMFSRRNIKLVETPLKKILHKDEVLTGVQLADDHIIEREGLFYAQAMPMVLKSQIGESLGCELNQFGLYKTTETGATTVDGVYACGDITKFGNVLIAAASGVTAGGAVVFELLNEKLNS